MTLVLIWAKVHNHTLNLKTTLELRSKMSRVNENLRNQNLFDFLLHEPLKHQIKIAEDRTF